MISDLGELLTTVQPIERPILELLISELRARLGMAKAVAYGLEATDEGDALRFSFVHLAGISSEHAGFIQASMKRSSRWGFFNPREPEPEQRDRPVDVPSFEEILKLEASEQRRLFARLGIFHRATVQKSLRRMRKELDQTLSRGGTGRLHQVRTLVCEGPQLLGWVGGWCEGPPGGDIQSVLQGLLPAIKQRLVLERRVDGGRLERLALEAALEHVPGAAFIVSQEGRVRHASAAGQAALAREPAQIGALLADVAAGRGRQTGCEIAEIRAPGVPTHYFVVLKIGVDELALRAERAGRRWGLTPRQREVLCLLARGEPNKGIANTLGCAVSTVEVHVSAILERADVENRSALIAALWTD